MPWILSQLMFFQSSIWTIHSIHSNQRDESSSFCNSIIFQETSLSSIPSICENIRWCDQWIIIVWYNKDSFTIHVVLLQISFEFNQTSLIVEDEVSITHDTSVILVSLIELNVVFHILLFSFESWESIHSLSICFPIYMISTTIIRLFFAWAIAMLSIAILPITASGIVLNLASLV